MMKKLLKELLIIQPEVLEATTIQKLIISSNENNTSIWDIISKIEDLNLKINSGTRKKLVNTKL